MALPLILNQKTKATFVRIPSFEGGYNVGRNAFEISNNELADGLNIDFIASTLTQKRLGTLQYNDVRPLGDGPITGLHAFYRVSAGATTLFLLVSLNTRLYRITRTGSTLLVIPEQSLTSGKKFYFQDFLQNISIMVNGAQAPMKWNGTGDVELLGIASPPGAPTAADDGAGSGSLDTAVDYFYKFTYYNSTYLTESNPSPILAAAVQTAASGEIDVTIPQDATADTQISHVRLYRTSGGGLSTDTLKWTGVNHVATGATIKAGTVVIGDTIADSALSTTLETDHTIPGLGGSTNFKFVASLYDRLWLIGEQTNPQKLYPSRLGLPEYFPIKFQIVVEDAQGSPTGFWVLQESILVIFFESSIHTLHGGYSPDAISLRVVTTELGNLSGRALAGDENGVYFVWHTGIYYFNGVTQPVRVGEKRVRLRDGNEVVYNALEPYFRNGADLKIGAQSLRQSAGGYRENKYYFSFSSTNQTSTQKVIARETDLADSVSPNVQTATLGGPDAILTLTNTQTGSDGSLELIMDIPFNDEIGVGQVVSYEIFISKDSRATWISKGRQVASWRSGETGLQEDLKVIPGIEAIPLRRERLHIFSDFDVTDIRVELLSSAVLLGEAQDEGDTRRLLTIDITSISYLSDSSTITAENDTTLVFHANRNIWTTPWTGFFPSVYETLSKGNDLNEFLFGDSREDLAFIRQLEIGNTDDGTDIFSFLESKQFDLDSAKMLNIFVDLLPSDGEITFELFVDLKEQFTEILRFQHGDEALYDDRFHGDVWYGEDKSFEEKSVVPYGVEKGKYFSFRLTNSDIYGFVIRSIILRYSRAGRKY